MDLLCSTEKTGPHPNDQNGVFFRLDLGGDLGLGVGDLDAELLGAGDDVDALSRGDVVGDPEKRVRSHCP